tara:strand:- start:8477 stop:9181 length:705 start_codon:yes stop_codon:yes gene_type:complete
MSDDKKKLTKPRTRRSRKVEPAWGLKDVELRKTEFDREFDESAIKVVLQKYIGTDEKKRNRFYMYLHGAQDAYWGTRETNAPSRAQVHAALDHLEKHAAPLVWAIENLDYLTELFLQQHARRKFPDISVEEILPALQTSLSDFLRVARSLNSNMPPSPRGRPPNEALHDFIRTLAYAFEELTGADASKGLTVDKQDHTYWSPFIAFAWDCLKAVDPDHGLSNQAFGEAARKAAR